MQSNLSSEFYNITVQESLKLELFGIITLSIFLGLMILVTVIGNLFVIAAIFIEKSLQGVENYLVLSLGIADLMVACLVMPLGAVYEVNQEWILGPVLCDIWTSFDVLCCTASILHLLAIAVDRFWSITHIDYSRQRSAGKIYIMIGIVWIISFMVSMAPIFGWKDDDFTRRIKQERRCLISQDIAYQIFATCSSFYIPLILILIFYWKIWKEARKRIRHKPGVKSVVIVKRHSGNITPPSVGDMVSCSSCSNGTEISTGRLMLLAKMERRRSNSKETVESKRERKAAKTLAIITGVFVVCWLPFFVVALLMPVCNNNCEFSPYIFSFFLWLGYANSMLNPIIYTMFSPYFRRAFRSILCGLQSTQRI